MLQILFYVSANDLNYSKLGHFSKMYKQIIFVRMAH